VPNEVASDGWRHMSASRVWGLKTSATHTILRGVRAAMGLKYGLFSKVSEQLLTMKKMLDKQFGLAYSQPTLIRSMS